VALAASALGCDTGFGQPCSLPKTEEFRRACNPVAADENQEDAGPNDPSQESRASCAVKDYAGCETRVCLVYRGSSSFCSEACTTSADCEGSAKCRTLLGDDDPDEVPDACEGFRECYCVRKRDL